MGEGDGHISVLTNVGTGIFSIAGKFQAYTYIDIGDESKPVFADIDNDSDLDLYVGESDGIINVFTNDLRETYAFYRFLLAAETLFFIEYISSPIFSDCDNDRHFL